MKKAMIAMILTMLLIGTSVNAAPPGVVVCIPDKTEVTDGQYIVTIRMDENDGFSAAQIELTYNENVVECRRVIPGELLQGMLTATNPAARGEATSALLSAAGTEDTTATGTLVSFVFSAPRSGDPAFALTALELTRADGRRLEPRIDIQNQYGSTDAPAGGGSAGTGGGITIQPVERPIEAPTAPLVFTDVPSTHWAKPYIERAAALGIVSGTGNGTFLPDKAMTRAEFATLLWNVSGKPRATAALKFTDVTEADWFYQAVTWAYSAGCVSGVTETEFRPNAGITREQAMTILHRYAGSPEAAYALGDFTDRADVSPYAEGAMSWAVANGTISGTSEKNLSPKINATRAQLATILVRFLNSK